MAVETTSEWVPAQYPRRIDNVDLRSLTGVQPKGYKERTVGKRKRDAETLEEDEQQPTAMEEEGQASGAPAEKRQKADAVMYRPVCVRRSGSGRCARRRRRVHASDVCEVLGLLRRACLCVVIGEGMEGARAAGKYGNETSHPWEKKLEQAHVGESSSQKHPGSKGGCGGSC